MSQSAQTQPVHTMAERLEKLHETRAHIEAGGGEKRLEKQRSQGKMTARERIDALEAAGVADDVVAALRKELARFEQRTREVAATEVGRRELARAGVGGGAVVGEESGADVSAVRGEEER